MGMGEQDKRIFNFNGLLISEVTSTSARGR